MKRCVAAQAAKAQAVVPVRRPGTDALTKAAMGKRSAGRSTGASSRSGVLAVDVACCRTFDQECLSALPEFTGGEVRICSCAASACACAVQVKVAVACSQELVGLYPCPSCCECCSCHCPNWRGEREAVMRHAASAHKEQVEEMQRLAEEEQEASPRSAYCVRVW